ncbi:hypothetical protein [Streptomyces formicae]|nr:hypothetical protein [Streptomyces formicae]
MSTAQSRSPAQPRATTPGPSPPRRPPPRAQARSTRPCSWTPEAS